jgi:1,4-alpha-glucan branching enzyme
MKKLSFLLLCFCTKLVMAQAPLLDWSPSFLYENQPGNITITANGAKGNAGLNGYTGNVYVHTGVITNFSTSPTDWKHVVTTWGTAGALPTNQAVSNGNNTWSFTIPGNLRTYYGLTNPAEKIIRITMLFRDAPGNLKLGTTTTVPSADMFIPVDTILGNLQMKFVQPPTEPRYIPWAEPIVATVGQALPIKVVTNSNSAITLNLNGTQIAATTATDSLLNSPIISQPCNNQITATANNGTSTVSQSINFFINGAPAPILALPTNLQDGINYLPGDTSVTLVLYAPNKSNVILKGSFNGWSTSCNELMNKTPDGKRWWKTINGLTPGTVYKFQYLVDGLITTTDPYCELLLDEGNDAFITASTYPNMPTYPVGQSGMVGTFQTAAPAYNWTSVSFNRPDKKNLIIYELLLRDFGPKHNWQTLIDSLNYLKKLGINCIEVMPVNEFDGNESWGYNPSFFFAPDKYYGSKNDMKKFIDEAHKIGIAVVMDVVLNQVTGNSPLAALYWNSTTNKPTPTNPWLNETATHPYSIFNDFNHESDVTKYHVARFIRHWLKEYKLDGFRWDLAKGFTQTNTGSNVGLWGNYDASRVAIWKRYNDSMQAVSPGSYCILEFLGGDQEESEYANLGLMLWGKQTDEYNENTMGQSGNKSIDRAYFKNRPGYNEPGLITYAESHDEERLMYKNLQFGNNSQTAHNTRTLNIALKRMEAMNATLLMIPGPKMIWQFGELGYDYSIFTCADSVTIINPDCKLANKPIRWDYFQIPQRKSIYTAIGKMNKLRALKPNLFTGATLTTGSDLGSNFIKRIVLNHPDMKIVTVANFDVVSQTFTQIFPANGKYYNYMSTDSISVSGGSKSLTLQPGEYKIYTSINLNDTVPSGATSIYDIKANEIFASNVYPNPAANNCTLAITTKQNYEGVITTTDATGKIVSIIQTGKQNGGEKEYFIDTKSYSNGLYFIRITLNGFTQVLPLQVIK